MSKKKRPKTIDERLDALVQSVELLASMHKDNEKRFERLMRIVGNHEHRIRRLEAQ